MPVVKGLLSSVALVKFIAKMSFPFTADVFSMQRIRSLLFLSLSRIQSPCCHRCKEQEKMGIVNLIHLLPFIDHRRAERGFITAHSFSAGERVAGCAHSRPDV